MGDRTNTEDEIKKAEQHEALKQTFLRLLDDEEFADLFKIAADFDAQVERSPETTLLYARLICAVSRREKLRPLDRDAVARVIEQAARIAGDADRLSANLRGFVDLLQEADQFAADADRPPSLPSAGSGRLIRPTPEIAR